jgi:hypothetical protein
MLDCDTRSPTSAIADDSGNTSYSTPPQLVGLRSTSRGCGVQVADAELNPDKIKYARPVWLLRSCGDSGDQSPARRSP